MIISLSQLDRVSPMALLSFFDNNFNQNIFTWEELLTATQGISEGLYETIKQFIDSNNLKTGSVLSVEANAMDLTVSLAANRDNCLTISDTSTITNLLQAICKVTGTEYLVSYNNIILHMS